ncbi:uncharacterized protein LOC134853330 isoform X2 [Symsagittifera roscoffensis]|uniref:uncharacterized protein LOC134853330 isoform X2 n=1 Tax=Symsagittifera roscoffensis TaxID=84072 RepID=UPI00307B13CF
MSSSNPRKFSEKIALQNQKAQEDLDRYNGILEEIRKAKNSSLRDVNSATTRDSNAFDDEQLSSPQAQCAGSSFKLQATTGNSINNNNSSTGSMSGLVSVSGHTVVSPASSGGSSNGGGCGSKQHNKFLSPAYPNQSTATGSGRAGSLPNVTALFRNQNRHIDLQNALANLNVLTDSANRGVSISSSAMPPIAGVGGGGYASSSRLSRSSDGRRGSLRGGTAAASSLQQQQHQSGGSSSNVLMNAAIVAATPSQPPLPGQHMGGGHNTSPAAQQHQQQQMMMLNHLQQGLSGAHPPPHMVPPNNLCLTTNHPLGGSSNMSRHRVDTSPYGSYLLPPGGGATSNDNSWRRTISDSRLYESASQPRRVPMVPGAPFGSERGPGPAPRLSLSKSKSPSNRSMYSGATGRAGDKRKMSDDQQMMTSYHREIMKSMHHSSPSPDSSAQQSPDTGSPATPGTRQHSLTIASPPMLNHNNSVATATAMNIPRPPSNLNPNTLHMLSPNENQNMASTTACQGGVSPNHPGGSLPDLSSGGYQQQTPRQLRNPNLETNSARIMSLSNASTTCGGGGLNHVNGGGPIHDADMHVMMTHQQQQQQQGACPGSSAAVFMGGNYVAANGMAATGMEDEFRRLSWSPWRTERRSSVALPLNLSNCFSSQPHQHLMQSTANQNSSCSNKMPNPNNNPSVVVTSAALNSSGGGADEAWVYMSAASAAYESCGGKNANNDSNTSSYLNMNSAAALRGDATAPHMSLVTSQNQSPPAAMSSDPLMFSPADDFTHQTVNAFSNQQQQQQQMRQSNQNSQQQSQLCHRRQSNKSPNGGNGSYDEMHSSYYQSGAMIQAGHTGGGGGGGDVNGGGMHVGGMGAGVFEEQSYMESLLNAASLSQIHQQMSYMKVSQDMDSSMGVQNQSHQPVIYVSEAQQQQQQQQAQMANQQQRTNCDLKFEPDEMLFESTCGGGVEDVLLPNEGGGEMTPVGPNDLGQVEAAGGKQQQGQGGGQYHHMGARQIGRSAGCGGEGGRGDGGGGSQGDVLAASLSSFQQQQQQRQIQVPDIVLTKSEEMDFDIDTCALQDMVAMHQQQQSVNNSSINALDIDALEPLTDADLRMLEEGEFNIDEPGLEETLG